MTDGDIEVWQITNLTGDTHPIHFHLVNVQILARQQFNPARFNGTPNLIAGTQIPPDATELGWKETVRMNPNEVIWVIMKFDLNGTQIKALVSTILLFIPIDLRSVDGDINGKRPPAPGRATTSMSGTATSWSTRSTT